VKLKVIGSLNFTSYQEKCSKKDSIAFKSDKKELEEILEDYILLNELELNSKYYIHDRQDAKVEDAINCIKEFGHWT
jgi:hypothetical protein